MIKKLFNSPIVKNVLIVILTLSVLLMFPNTRAFADDVLSLFRVEQVIVLPVPSVDSKDEETFGVALSNLFTSSTLIIDELEEQYIVKTFEEATNIAGFEARKTDELTPTQIIVIDDSAFVMKLDRSKIQLFLDESGRSDIHIPEEADGAEIFVNIPFAIQTDFGYCDIDCITFLQIPSPTVDMPDNINISELIKLGLTIFGMPDSEAEQFTQTIDWTTTLVIPIPKNNFSSFDVVVDGVTGKLIQSYTPNHLIVWVKNGIIYMINGRGTDTSLSLKIANSLR